MASATKKKLTLADLKSLILVSGSHSDRSNGICAMEAAAQRSSRVRMPGNQYVHAFLE